MKKIGKMVKKRYQEKGQSLVEFAVSLVLILTILAGAADLGRMFFYYIAMRDAAQEGVLYGSAFPDEYDEIIARAQDLLSGNAVVTVNINDVPWAAANACSPNEIEVIVTSTFDLTMPFFAGADNQINLRAHANGTILRPLCN
jgi:Flp pilus assembly protein TadG